jgi:Bacterial Ig domain/Lysyl oxidase
VLGALVLVGSAFAVAANPKPDLVPELPATRPAGLGNSVAPIYVDPWTNANRVLYRFDTVIRNQGGTMDLYMQNGNAYQVIWQNGHPPGPVSPNHAPTPGPNIVSIENRTAQKGAFFVYSNATGHMHWHFQNAARYELLMPGGGSVQSAKVGFCMFDTYPSTTTGKTRYFADGYTGGGEHSWCNRLDPGATFTRMGISPTYGDLYMSQAAWQWIDITGLKPQSYDLKATVNPQGYVDEGTATGNNVKTVHRTIPGTIANAATKSVAHGKALQFGITGTVVNPSIPGLKKPTATPCPVRTSMSCYVIAKSTGPLTFAISQGPAHGTLSLVSKTGLTQTVRYTPNAGFSGTDTFRFTVMDVRHLTSQPATVTLHVG